MLHSCSLPRPSADPVEALIDHFGSIARSLVVVDGVDRASAAAANVINRLLSQCPHTQVLGTGIEPLHVPGEVVHVVPAMTMPDSCDDLELRSLSGFDATRLFIERAATTSGRQFDDADAVHIVELCRGLHGGPLAIELAAARVRSTPISELVESLGALVDAGGADDLARTLASSIEWTYQLLDVDAQTALRRLGVFHGDIEIDAATAVVHGGELDDRATAAALRRLFDQQLLTFDDASGRAGMSAAVRMFARDRLLASSEVEVVMARHGAWFAAVAERFDDRSGADEALPMSLFAPDEGDVLAALHRSMESDGPLVAYRILVVLGAKWSSIGRPEIGAEVATWLTTRPPSDGEEMWAAAVARSCHERSGDPDSPIHRFAEEARAIAELVGDEESPRFLSRPEDGAARSVPVDMADRP